MATALVATGAKLAGAHGSAGSRCSHNPHQNGTLRWPPTRQTSWHCLISGGQWSQKRRTSSTASARSAPTTQASCVACSTHFSGLDAKVVTRPSPSATTPCTLATLRVASGSPRLTKASLPCATKPFVQKTLVAKVVSPSFTSKATPATVATTRLTTACNGAKAMAPTAVSDRTARARASPSTTPTSSTCHHPHLPQILCIQARRNGCAPQPNLHSRPSHRICLQSEDGT